MIVQQALGTRFWTALALIIGLVGPVQAQQTRIDPGRDSVSVILQDATVTISRDGPPCPPACIQPMQSAPGVTTWGEIELIDFLAGPVASGTGLLVDTRLPEVHAIRTLPGAVNVPQATLSPDNPYRPDLLTALGVGSAGGAFGLLLFSDGAADPLARMAVTSLLDAGYPADRLYYYRAGLSGWMALGLNTVPGG